MKKVLAIVVLLVYGLSSTGMTVHFQYCCGKLEKIDLTPSSTKHCGGEKGNKVASKGCCDDKEVNLKISSEQSPGKVLNASFFFIAIKPELPRFVVSNPVVTKKLLPEVFAPPPLIKELTHLYCIYRI